MVGAAHREGEVGDPPLPHGALPPLPHGAIPPLPPGAIRTQQHSHVLAASKLE